jgi:hypothetical protein
VSLRPLVALADRSAPLPAAPAEQRDAAARALAALAAEERRLARLAIEPALSRCRTERRYWSFVHALLTVAQTDRRSLPEVW